MPEEKKVIENLEQESAAWVNDGLISEEQRTKILSRYTAITRISSKRQRFTGIVATLGALLVGIGIILFFASNWDKISPFQKMVLLLTALLGSYIIGYRLSTKHNGYPRMAFSFYFLGTILYGSNIFLVAQSYNIQSHWPNGVLWWGIGILPLAFILSSRAIATLAVAVFSFWLGSELWTTIYSFVKNGIFLYGIAYALWGCGIMGTGYLMERLAQFEKISRVFQRFGLFFIFSGLYPFSFRDKHTESGSGLLMEIFSKKDFFLWFCIGITLICVLSLLIAYSRKLSKKEMLLGLWILVSVVLTWITGFFLAPLTTLTAILMNIILFLGIISILFIGYLTQLAFCVNIGLLAFAAIVIGRYFDFAWAYMERSAAFILGGLLLLLLGFTLERGRRKLLERSIKE